jgi:hypothetical protein
MNQNEHERGLSTADMVAAGERANGNSQGDAGVKSGGQAGSLAEGSVATTGESRPLGPDGMETMDREDRLGQSRMAGNGAGANTGIGSSTSGEPPLVTEADAGQFRARWDEIQRGFVDEPRKSVEQADNLVAEAIQKLAKVFADERSRLEGQWSRGDQVSTDDLRIALQRYRSFFQRLLSV